MKHLIIILILFFSSFAILPKEVVIETDIGKKTVIVPDNQVDLEKVYLLTMKNYINAENDLQKALALNDDLSSDIFRLKNNLNSMLDENVKLINLINSNPAKVKAFQPYIIFGAEYIFTPKVILGQNVNFNINLGFGFNIFEKVSLGIMASCPDFSVGGFMTVNLDFSKR